VGFDVAGFVASVLDDFGFCVLFPRPPAYFRVAEAPLLSISLEFVGTYRVVVSPSFWGGASVRLVFRFIGLPVSSTITLTSESTGGFFLNHSSNSDASKSSANLDIVSEQRTHSTNAPNSVCNSLIFASTLSTTAKSNPSRRKRERKWFKSVGTVPRTS